APDALSRRLSCAGHRAADALHCLRHRPAQALSPQPATGSRHHRKLLDIALLGRGTSIRLRTDAALQHRQSFVVHPAESPLAAGRPVLGARFGPGNHRKFAVVREWPARHRPSDTVPGRENLTMPSVSLEQLGAASLWFAGFVGVLFVGSLLLPGRVKKGAAAPNGCRPRYKLNGLLLCALVLAGVGAASVSGMLPLAMAAPHFWALFIVANIFAFGLATVLFLKRSRD